MILQGRPTLTRSWSINPAQVYGPRSGKYQETLVEVKLGDWQTADPHYLSREDAIQFAHNIIKAVG